MCINTLPFVTGKLRVVQYIAASKDTAITEITLMRLTSSPIDFSRDQVHNQIQQVARAQPKPTYDGSIAIFIWAQLSHSKHLGGPMNYCIDMPLVEIYVGTCFMWATAEPVIFWIL